MQIRYLTVFSKNLKKVSVLRWCLYSSKCNEKTKGLLNSYQTMLFCDFMEANRIAVSKPEPAAPHKAQYERSNSYKLPTILLIDCFTGSSLKKQVFHWIFMGPHCKSYFQQITRWLPRNRLLLIITYLLVRDKWREQLPCTAVQLERWDNLGQIFILQF